ncbi:hypothetical protein Srubr_69520 [Streptomyces rubradiris]|uniref:Uncharacterized protein n=1 Tax=Streptomyces rubradiris TaxID=285531 RepID=A0ABQ3RML3_STRRR|nr:hypothetical protein GCM10018792_19550 [Streptomyces rubradiris]GHI57106.1 hypothetical protein Srubr_69520 [Streptomyces rubradiris]
MLAHRLGRAEAGLPGHLVHRQLGGLQQLPGPLHALLGEPLAGADAGLLAEAPGEGAHRHRLLCGHVPQLDRLVQPAERPGAGGRRRRELGIGHRALHVLGLAAVAVGRYDRDPGDLVGDRRTEVAPDHVQAQIDPGGHPGRGQHVAVVDEQHVGVHLDLREHPLEPLGVGPVRGGRAAVQTAGGGEDVGAGAYGGEPGAGADMGEGDGEFVGEPALLVDRAQLVRGRDDHRVGGGQRLRAVRDVEGEVGVRVDPAGRADGAGDDLVQAAPQRVPGPAEDPVRDAQFEGQQAVQSEDGDPVRAEIPFGGHGPILANAVLRATRCDRCEKRNLVT